MNIKTIIVNCSPGGSTRHVSDIIKNELNRIKIQSITFDLAKEKNWSTIFKQIKLNEKNSCIFIGSPVYISRAIPPVMKFIELLPKVEYNFAVPFVTWGGATSGIALWELGKALIEKGFKLAGAAKVLAVHSLMWRSKNPVSKGHPDLKDDKIVQELVIKIIRNLQTGNIQPINLKDLDYQPKDWSEDMKKKEFNITKHKVPERILIEDKCIKCGVCQEECPVDAITLNPYPEFGEDCIRCFNCMRLCPENAIEADLSGLEKHLRNRVEINNELPYTRAFI